MAFQSFDLSVPDEGYSRNALCALNLIHSFLLHHTCVRATMHLCLHQIPCLHVYVWHWIWFRCYWLWRIFVELFFYWFNPLLHIICFQGKIDSKDWSVLGRYYFPIKETRMTSIIRIAVNHNIINSLRIDFFLYLDYIYFEMYCFDWSNVMLKSNNNVNSNTNILR